MDVTLTSEVTVRLVQRVGSDAIIVQAARASTRGRGAVPDADAKLIGYLMRMGHSSPFEHGYMTVEVHAPAMVWWEWVRHRFQAVDCPDLSFNLESARYRELEPVAWVPAPGRPVVESPGHRPARPKYQPDEERRVTAAMHLGRVARFCFDAYEAMLSAGIAGEVARAALPFGVYYSGFCSGNPLAWMNFLSKRTHDESAARVSYPQAEIEQAALAVERMLADGWPATYAAWINNGRTAP